jgi:hypothetical protein
MHAMAGDVARVESRALGGETLCGVYLAAASSSPSLMCMLAAQRSSGDERVTSKARM